MRTFMCMLVLLTYSVASAQEPAKDVPLAPAKAIHKGECATEDGVFVPVKTMASIAAKCSAEAEQNEKLKAVLQPQVVVVDAKTETYIIVGVGLGCLVLGGVGGYFLGKKTK